MIKLNQTYMAGVVFLDAKTITAIVQLPGDETDTRVFPRRTRVEYGKEGCVLVQEEAEHIHELVQRELRHEQHPQPAQSGLTNDNS